ncbi:hypothetical protein SARC_15127, partial [Sphaeroforma arctica JP610]
MTFTHPQSFVNIDAYKKTIKHDAQFHQYTTDETIAIRSKLLDWYDSNQRILPWRVPS